MPPTNQIIVVRHASAEDKEAYSLQKKPDSQRPLTLKGRKKMEQVAKKSHDLFRDIDLIVSSPFVRARQTADIISKECPARIVEFQHLTPDSSLEEFVDWLNTLPKKYKKVAIVGHEPHLSLLVSYLLTGNTNSFLEFKKSGFACLEINSFQNFVPGKASLKWLIQPKLLVGEE